MRQTYRRAMQGLYIGCIALSGLAMVAITVIIPSGVDAGAAYLFLR